MKKPTVYSLALIVITVSMTIALLPNVSSQSSSLDNATNIKVTDYAYYLDLSGVLEVVGQVQNQGPNTIQEVVLRGAVLSDASPSTSAARVWVQYLLPQQEAPFMMSFSAPQDASDWRQVHISDVQFTAVIANATTGYIYPDLKIASKTAFVNTTGNYNGAYQVNGVIKNTGTQTATNLTVVGAFFNKDGHIVAVANTPYLNPRELPAGGTLKFEMWALDQNQSQVSADYKIASYSLLIQAGAPILQGQPIVSSDPNSEGTSDPTNGQTNPSFFSPVVIAIIVVIAVIAIVTVVAAIKFGKHPKAATTKEKLKQRKQ